MIIMPLLSLLFIPQAVILYLISLIQAPFKHTRYTRGCYHHMPPKLPDVILHRWYIQEWNKGLHRRRSPIWRKKNRKDKLVQCSPASTNEADCRFPLSWRVAMHLVTYFVLLLSGPSFYIGSVACSLSRYSPVTPAIPRTHEENSHLLALLYSLITPGSTKL
jgi:hypothetical protein